MVKVILKITVMIRLIIMVKDINKKEDLESSIKCTLCQGQLNKKVYF